MDFDTTLRGLKEDIDQCACLRYVHLNITGDDLFLEQTHWSDLDMKYLIPILEKYKLGFFIWSSTKLILKTKNK